MKVLRSTVYPPEGVPLTVVMRDTDIKVPVEQAATMNQPPEALVVHDIFTVEDGSSIVEATFEGEERARLQRKHENNMAVLFYYNAAQLERIVDGGVLVNPAPAPLSADNIAAVFDQLREHPSYTNQRVVTT